MKPSLTLNLTLVCCLSLAASCASATGLSSSKNSNRGRSGQISAKQFLEADWKSSGLNGDVAADDQLAVTVAVFDMEKDPSDNYDFEMMRYLESELGGLGRFPVQPLADPNPANMMRDLHQLGEVELPDGNRRQVDRRYAIIFRYKRGEKHYKQRDVDELKTVSADVHRYWLEGELQVLEVTQNAGDDRIVYADRTFRTSPNFKVTMKAPATGPLAGTMARRVCPRDSSTAISMQDVLFRISKEIYTKLCVQGGHRSLRRRRVCTARNGPHIPRRSAARTIDLRLLGPRQPPRSGGQGDRDGPRRQPGGPPVATERPRGRRIQSRSRLIFSARADRKVVVQTEKLAVSDVDSERLQELERLSQASITDEGWMRKLPKAQEQIKGCHHR